jgi:hypothetical protein
MSLSIGNMSAVGRTMPSWPVFTCARSWSVGSTAHLRRRQRSAEKMHDLLNYGGNETVGMGMTATPPASESSS